HSTARAKAALSPSYAIPIDKSHSPKYSDGKLSAPDSRKKRSYPRPQFPPTPYCLFPTPYSLLPLFAVAVPHSLLPQFPPLPAVPNIQRHTHANMIRKIIMPPLHKRMLIRKPKLRLNLNRERRRDTHKHKVNRQRIARAN